MACRSVLSFGPLETIAWFLPGTAKGCLLFFRLLKTLECLPVTSSIEYRGDRGSIPVLQFSAPKNLDLRAPMTETLSHPT